MMYEGLIQELRHGELVLGMSIQRRQLMNKAAAAIEILSQHDSEVDEIARQFCEVRESLGCNTMDELMNIVRGGRVLALPCPIGAKVYVVGAKYRHGRWETWVNPANFRLSDLEKLGKTVFLTEDAARAAIKEMELTL